MPITDIKNCSFSMIDIKRIDPSPYQLRKYFDVEKGKKPEYLTVVKTPLKRVVKLLSKLDSIRVSKDKDQWFPRRLMTCSINLWNR